VWKTHCNVFVYALFVKDKAKICLDVQAGYAYVAEGDR
jgi:hypothetical protein